MALGLRRVFFLLLYTELVKQLVIGALETGRAEVAVRFDYVCEELPSKVYTVVKDLGNNNLESLRKAEHVLGSARSPWESHTRIGVLSTVHLLSIFVIFGMLTSTC